MVVEGRERWRGTVKVNEGGIGRNKQAREDERKKRKRDQERTRRYYASLSCLGGQIESFGLPGTTSVQDTSLQDWV